MRLLQLLAEQVYLGWVGCARSAKWLQLPWHCARV